MFGMQVPAFMLRQFYQAGSLENVPDGFQFVLSNPLMAATIVEVLEVSAGGLTYELGEIEFAQGSAVRQAASVTEVEPVTFQKGSTVTIKVKGYNLNPGTHPIQLKVRTEEFGSLKVTAEDTVGGN